MSEPPTIGSIADRVVLNNGIEMPWLGLGVLQIGDAVAVSQAVRQALRVGYRSIDTASIYGNEAAVGEAIRDSGLAREEIFLTTKVWNDAQRERRVQAAFDESLVRLQLDYVDLYLVHWPVAGRIADTWRAMEAIHRGGCARAIGVCNFMPQHLDELSSTAGIVPAVNQVEFHPLLVQPDLVQSCRDRHVQLVAWSPLMKGHVVQQRPIVDLARKYGKTPAQVVLRWDLQHRVVTIPRSKRAERIAENGEIFDFALSAADMRLLDSLDEGRRFGPDPCNFDF